MGWWEDRSVGGVKVDLEPGEEGLGGLLEARGRSTSGGKPGCLCRLPLQVAFEGSPPPLNLLERRGVGW
jgi:hypothetical protein